MKTCRMAALAAAVSMALVGTASVAATPASNALPGHGKVASGAASGAVTGSANAPILTIALADNSVINWGGNGADINKTGAAGFNIGSNASVGFTGGFGALNVDVSGNPSQIYGALSSDGNVYVADANGIIVGPTASISAAGAVGLIANKLPADTSAFAGSVADVGFDGAGGSVTVSALSTGSGIASGTILISGGGTVNVDLGSLTGGAVSLMAGTALNGGAFATANRAATLVVNGALGGAATLAAFRSAGDASSSGVLELDAGAAVAGTLTNTGSLKLGPAFSIGGALANYRNVVQAGDAGVDGGITNAGAWDGGGFDLAAGGLLNNAQMSDLGSVTIADGGFVNNGEFNAAGMLDVTGGVTNTGNLTAAGVMVLGGDLVNRGSVAATDASNGVVYVTNGNILNAGEMRVAGGSVFDFDGGIQTFSDASDASFTTGADYSITNTGTIAYTGPGAGLHIAANAYQTDGGGNLYSSNGSTGSFTNSGIIQIGASGTAPSLIVEANRDIWLGGALQFTNGESATAANPFNVVDLFGSTPADFVGLNPGTTTLTTLVTARGDDPDGDAGVQLVGNQVVVAADIDATKVVLGAGDKPAGYTGSSPATDYAVRVARGVTVTGEEVTIEGVAFDEPGFGYQGETNAILQGTLHGQVVLFQGSDLYAGSDGRIIVGGIDSSASAPMFEANFSGAIKTAPYLNDPNNFRFNYLSIANGGAAGAPLLVILNPSGYATNGTSNGKSAVNLLVDTSVNLAQHDSGIFSTPVINGNGTAVTGVDSVPNTHLVLQSAGSIATGTVDGFGPTHTFVAGDFYWPGYVYLGTIAADADGNPQPGTLGLGTIRSTGNFSNVLPGDVAGASGMHFITQFPLALGGLVTTNANAWVNFGSDALTSAYRSGTQGAGAFFGGVQGPGNVVTYGPLAPANFVTHAPSDAP